MEEFKTLTQNSSVVQIASRLRKIYKIISDEKRKNTMEHNIREIDFLRSQCKSDILQLSLMSCQTFVRLVENGVLDVNSVLSMFVSLLTNSNENQYTAITEGITCVLLYSLKKSVVAANKGSEQNYKCPFSLKTPQHPMITLIQKNGENMNDMANRINGICTHNDKDVKENSIEFLRPVFLYIICNPQKLQDTKNVWTGLLLQTKVSQEADEMVSEILSWSKLSTPNQCLSTSILICEAIDSYMNQKQHEKASDLCLYLVVIVDYLISYGIDPRQSLQCIYRTLKEFNDINSKFFNIFLVLTAKLLHTISPFYLHDLFRLLVYVVIVKNTGNQYILNMILDPLIQWMSQISFIPKDSQQMIHKLIDHILKKDEYVESDMHTYKSKVRNYHPDIALAFDIVQLSENFQHSESTFTFVDTLYAKSQPSFCKTINYFLRSLFLSKELSIDCWFKVYQVILSVVKTNEDVAVDFMTTFIYKLAKEVNPEAQLELLRGLPNFAVAKDNIPMVLNTIKTLASGDNIALCMDLHLRLWKIEKRVYSFLFKVVSQNYRGKAAWEFNIAKATVINEICYERPSTDLIPPLSDILNECSGEDGDLATSIALNAISTLCASNAVNIVSTWKQLCGKFRRENRPRSLKSLFNFFSEVPNLRTATAEYEKLLDEALDQLWLFITTSDNAEVIKEAIKALKNFDIESTMQAKHIPEVLFENIEFIMDYPRRGTADIPGEVWVQLLRKIDPHCIRDAADLLTHYITDEIERFPNVMYRYPEGKPEPTSFKNLPPESILRAVIHFLKMQARMGDHVSDLIVPISALRTLTKKFPKPIPPFDWTFLHTYLDMNFESRKYAIIILKNQCLHSMSARRLLENYLMNFEPNCFEEDLLLLFSLLPDLANGVAVPVLKSFVDKVAAYCLRESQMNNFAEGCLFEKFLDSVKHVYPRCEVTEAKDVFTPIIERHMDSMDLDSRLFEKYTEAVSNLEVESINGLTTPKTWWEIPTGKLKKALLIRCYLVLYNTKLPNPLNWLNAIVDAYADHIQESKFFFRHLAVTLYAFKDDQNACSWVIDLFRQTQSLLLDPSNSHREVKYVFLLDILALSVATFSGCAVLLGNLDIIAMSRDARIEIFPESLQLLCDRVFWKENEAKIYEYLFDLYKNTLTPNAFADAMKEAILCSRNRPYFESKGIWTKYVGLRK